MSFLFHRLMAILGFVSVCLLVSAPALAAEAASGADTAWILTSTALVLFMTLPGLAMFYGGLVRSQNVLSVLMHCFSIACVMSLLWLAVAYSLAFLTAIQDSISFSFSHDFATSIFEAGRAD